MCFSQVNDIDKVTDTRTVRCIIIVTKHAKFLTDTDGCLGQIWNQVLRNPVRQFTQQCSRMRTNRVEIAQHDRIDRSTWSYRVTNNLFIDLFGISIRWFRFLDRSFFRYRQLVRLTVYCTRRREHNTFYSMLWHQFEKVNQRNQVITVVKQRFLYRFSYCFASCKVNDSLNSFIFCKYCIQTGKVQAIQLFKNWTNTGNFLYIVNNVSTWIW